MEKQKEVSLVILNLKIVQLMENFACMIPQPPLLLVPLTAVNYSKFLLFLLMFDFPEKR